MRAVLVFGAVTSLVAGMACASTRYSGPTLYNPIVSLRDVRMSGVGITGGTMEIELNVYNPNPDTLHQPRFAYRVVIADRQVAKGIYDADFALPGNDSVKVRLPATFGFAGATSAGRAIMNNGSLNYRVLGEIVVRTEYGRYRFPYDRAGWFAPLSKALPE